MPCLSLTDCFRPHWALTQAPSHAPAYRPAPPDRERQRAIAHYNAFLGMASEPPESSHDSRLSDDSDDDGTTLRPGGDPSAAAGSASAPPLPLPPPPNAGTLASLVAESKQQESLVEDAGGTLMRLKLPPSP